MGESAKKWLAGIGAALLVAVIGGIAIGKIERKSVPELSPQMSAGQALASSQMPTAQPQRASAEKGSSTQTIAPTMGNRFLTHPESTSRATSVTALQKTLVRGQKVHREPESTAGGKAPNQPGSVAAEVPSGSSQMHVAQSKPSLAPPDVATPTVMEATPAAMQVSQTEGMNVTGNVNVNGEFTKISRLVYPNDQVLTPGQNGALVTAKQNAIALGATTQFKPESMNSFLLDGGASNVSTKTGMTAKMKDWRVQPVHPAEATQYEVTYESDGVYVYARVNDVDVINDICRRSIRVEQGKVVKIPSARGCGILWVQNEVGTLPYKLVWGSAAAAGTGVLIWIATHQERANLSPP